MEQEAGLALHGLGSFPPMHSSEQLIRGTGILKTAVMQLVGQQAGIVSSTVRTKSFQEHDQGQDMSSSSSASSISFPPEIRAVSTNPSQLILKSGALR